MADQPCILILDDDPAVGEQLKACCDRAGYKCCVFSKMTDAVGILQKGAYDFDLAVIDLTLLKEQGSSGFDFLDYIRSCRRVRATLAVTGRNDGQAGIQAMEQGALYYLEKPIAESLFLPLVAILRKQQGLSISPEEEQRIRDCDVWTLFRDFMGLNQEVMQLLIRARGARQQLQKLIDAMGVEVAVLDPEGKVVLVNQRLRDTHENIDVALQEKSLTSSKLYPLEVGQQSNWVDDLSPVSERVLNGRYYKLERQQIKDYFGGNDYAVVTATDTTFMKQIQTILRRLSQIETLPFPAAAQAIVTLLHENGFPQIQFFRTKDGQTFQLTASTQLSLEEIRTLQPPYELKNSDPLIAEALRTRKPVKRHCSEVREVRRPGPLGVALVGWFVKTILQSVDRAHALLCIEYGAGNGVPTAEQMLMIEAITPALGDVFSIIVRKEEEEQRRALHEFIHSIHAKLTGFEKEGDVLDCIVAELSTQFKSTKSYMMLETPDCNAGEMIIAHSCRKPSYDHSAYRARSDIGVNRIAFHEKTVQIVTDYGNHPKALEYRQYIHEKQPEALSTIEAVRSIVLLPILQGEQCIGLLVLTFDEQQQFEPWIEPELQTFANLVSLILANIQKMKRLEEEVRRKTTLEDMAMLGAGIMHAVKSDLHEAKALVENLRNDPTADSVAYRVPNALTCINHAFQIIQSFSDLARPQSTESSCFDFVDLIMSILEIWKRNLRDNRIDLKLDIAKSIHPVFGPPGALRIAIFDLFANAIRLMKNGGTLTVRIRNDVAAQNVILEIEDTGPGMDERQLKQVSRLGPGNSIPAGGIGLGLYLANRVVTLARGTFTPKSKLGYGTTMVVCLPVEKRS